MFQTLIYPPSGAWCLFCRLAKRTPPNTSCDKSSNTQRTENKTTDVVIHQHSRKLLKMDILMPETCWAHNKWNKIASDINLVFHSSTIAMMHGPINIRFTECKVWWYCLRLASNKMVLLLTGPTTTWHIKPNKWNIYWPRQIVYKAAAAPQRDICSLQPLYLVLQKKKIFLYILHLDIQTPHSIGKPTHAHF